MRQRGCSALPRECLRRYGQIVGQFPLYVCLFSFCLVVGLGITGVALCAKSGAPAINEKTMEELWTMQGGRQEYEIRTAIEKHHNAIPDDEDQKTIIVLISGIDENKDGDLATPEIFRDLFELYSLWYSTTVTTSFNTTWNIHDFCIRGSTPDVPGPGGLIFPCFVISPFDCFSENVINTHPSWQGLDFMLGADAPWPLAMFSNRPSLANITNAQLKEILSGGCKWWLDFLVFHGEDWGGSLSWDNSSGPGQERLNFLNTLVPQLFYEPPKNAKSRLQHTKRAEAELSGNPIEPFLDDYEEAVDLHIEAWMKEVKAFNAKSGTLKVNALVFPDWYEEIAEESAQASFLSQIGGVTCMVVFIICALGNFGSPLESRAAVALKGLLLVLISAISSAGIALLVGLQFNSVTLIVLPNLALGLGVNDMFVLLRSFSELGTPFISSHDFSDVSAAIFAEAGVGVLLTSLCNFVSLVGCALTLNIAVIQDSCWTIAIVVMVNFLSMTTMFPYFLYVEKCRVTQQQPEKMCCTYFHQAAALRNNWQERASTSMSDAVWRFVACIADPEKSDDHRPLLLRLFLPECRPASLGRFIFKNGLLIMSLFLAVFSFGKIQDKVIGYSFAELVPNHMVDTKAGAALLDTYGKYLTYMYFDNIDLPNRQEEIIELYFALVNSSCSAARETPWFTEFYNNHFPTIPNGLDDSYTHNGCASCSPPVSPLAPMGIVRRDSDFFYAQYKNWTTLPEVGIPGVTPSYASAERCKATEFALHDDGTVDLSFFGFWITKGARTAEPENNVFSDAELVECIGVVREIVDNSTLAGEAFPFGTIELAGRFTMWEVFRSIDESLFLALSVTLGCILVVTTLVLGSVTSAVSSTMAISFILVQIYGVFMMLAPFNAFVVSGLVVAAGMSVEFTAHLVAQFSVEEGTAHDRIGRSLSAVSEPILQGTISTFLAILPLVLSPIEFFIKYSFLLTSLTLVVGWVNGQIILPAFLVTIASIEDNLSFQKKKEDSQHPDPATSVRRMSRDSVASVSHPLNSYAVNATDACVDTASRSRSEHRADVATARTELTF